MRYIKCFSLLVLGALLVVSLGCSKSTEPEEPSSDLPENEQPESITVPSIPAGPDNGYINQSYTYSTGGAVCNDGGSIEYRFDWGDGGYSQWTSVTSASHAYQATGTYQLCAEARCAGCADGECSRSQHKQVEIRVVPHGVGTPRTPMGPANGYVEQALTYTSGGAVCSQGHPVQYQLDWGSGETSDWSGSASAAHVWAAIGDYPVRARARCSVDTSVESGWSGTLTVTIE
jgi:hypothetical protein